MKTRRFGPGGPELPALGYGAMSLGNAGGRSMTPGPMRC
jgi:aryl-alcohol dehydrogenase-like predicted oxidoreductase